MKIKIIGIISVTVLFASLLLGCTSDNNTTQQAADNNSAAQENQENNNSAAQNNQENNHAFENNDNEDAFDEEVVLTVWNGGAGINDEEILNELIAEPVQEHYPNISFERVTGDLEELIAAGDTPDILADGIGFLETQKERGLASDLRDFVETKSIDLSRFEPVLFETLDHFSDDDGELYGFPFGMNYGAVVYNQDIFDHFGVSYPTDNMTWNELIDLSREVTQEDDEGVPYIGMNPKSANALINAYGLPVIDDQHEHATFTSEPYADEYVEVFELVKQMYDIPGVIDADGNYDYNHISHFIEEGRVAIHPYWMAGLTSFAPQFEDAGINNWDIVSWPTFEGRPGVGRNAGFHILIVSPVTENKEAAYRTIEVITSDEVQREMNQNSRITVLNDPELRSEHMADSALYEGKNVEGVFSVDASSPPMDYNYEHRSEILPILNESASLMATEGLDVNSALRIATEEANTKIQELAQQ